MKRILLVEDQENLRELYAGVLRGAGYQVTVAADGEEGVAAVSAEVPDLILMDLNMPIMDGLRATKALKAADSSHQIPVIALTSSAMPEEVAEGLAAGCDAYIVKPINPNDLLPELKLALELISGDVNESSPDDSLF
ncbi:MAG: response regulator [Myxococcales bacterium]|nr:response regulator [Myxococcales bacterium]